MCHHICEYANIIDRYFENILAYTITDGNKTVFIIFCTFIYLFIYLLFAVIIQKTGHSYKNILFPQIFRNAKIQRSV